jgi:hypothetical protein
MLVRLRTDRLQERRQQTIDAAGEPLVLQAEQAIQQALTYTNIYIQVEPDALTQILMDGRFKTAFELSQNDLDELEVRCSAEQIMYGYPPNHPVIERPVSGFLAVDSNLNEAPLIRDFNAYGTVSIELKAEIKSNASFTLNDSLTAPTAEQRGREVSWQPSALLAIDIASLVSLRDNTVELICQRVAQLANIKTIADIAKFKELAYRYNNYMEVGIHGGLTTKMIAKIVTMQIDDISQQTIELSSSTEIGMKFDIDAREKLVIYKWDECK